MRRVFWDCCEQLLCFSESFVPFTVFRFIHLEEFWLITAPCTAHEQYSTFVIVVSKRGKERRRRYEVHTFEGVFISSYLRGIIRGIRYRDSKIKLRSETERKYLGILLTQLSFWYENLVLLPYQFREQSAFTHRQSKCQKDSGYLPSKIRVWILKESVPEWFVK